MSRLWMRVVTRHKIVKQAEAPCTVPEVLDVLTELCMKNDLPRPMWLNKHESEFGEFRRTAFTKEHFVEDVNFDRLEIEFLEDSGEGRRSKDPRNDFSDDLF